MRKGEKRLKPRKRGWLTTLFSRYVSVFHHPLYYRKFYLIGRERMPEDGNPVVLVSNHQNCLIDPLALVFALTDRKPHFLTRASVFANPLFDKILREFGCLPTYRAKVDGVRGVSKNKGTLEEVAVALSHGETVALYPEGQHQNKRWLGAFSQAYLKMAFGAAEESNFEKEVYVMPSAHHYSHYRLPREEMIILFGEPIALSPYYEEYKEHPREVMSKVNDLVRERILDMMLNVDDLEHYEEIDFLRLSEFGNAFAERNSLNPNYLPDKLKADKLLVARLAKATEEKPEEMAELFGGVKSVARDMKQLGLRDWLFEGRRSVGGLLLWALGMLALLPLFGASLSATWFIFLLPLVVNTLFIKDRQFRGSINLAATLLVTYPLSALVPAIVMLCNGQWIAALGFLVVLPLMLVFAINYMRWAAKWLGYARFVLGNRKKINRLATLRTQLYNKLKEIVG